MAPLAKVTAGSLYVYEVPGLDNRRDFAIETADFAAQFDLADAGSVLIPEWPTIGTSMHCDANLGGGQTLRNGFVDFGGHPHQKLWFEGWLSFKTETSILIPSLPAHAPINLSTSFTLTGNLIAYPTDPFAEPPPKTFTFDLIGKGVVTIRLAAPLGPTRKLTSYFYRFI